MTAQQAQEAVSLLASRIASSFKDSTRLTARVIPRTNSVGASTPALMVLMGAVAFPS